MISNFFKIIFSMLLILGPAKAMLNGAQEEETSKLLQIKPTQQNTNRRETIPLTPYKQGSTLDVLPDDILLAVFRFLGPSNLGRAAQVSTYWKKITETHGLWKYMGITYYGDYLSEEDLKEHSKQKVISHYLSVIVNTTEDLRQIERLVSYYQLHLYTPFFKQYAEPIFLTGLETRLFNSRDFIVQTNPEIIWKKIDQLCATRGQYSGYPLTARELNDLLVERGNPKAINRKIESLTKNGEQWVGLGTSGWAGEGGIFENTPGPLVRIPLHGYRKNISKAREFIEILVEAGNPTGIERKIEGLAEGKYGYIKDLPAARKLNELLIEKRDPEAIKRKTEGLAEGKYGYAKDQVTARTFNDLLIEKGDQDAIERKIEGLNKGQYGYEQNLVAAREIIEALIEKKNLKANEKKIESHLEGKYGYNKDLETARTFNDLLVDKGDQSAIERKVEGLAEGKLGYKADPAVAREFNEPLVGQGDSSSIKRKIKGLLEGKYGYKIDPIAAREFIESLVVNEIPIARAIGKYIKAFAMKYGVYQLGYEKDREKAVEFIKQNYVPY